MSERLVKDDVYICSPKFESETRDTKQTEEITREFQTSNALRRQTTRWELSH